MNVSHSLGAVLLLAGCAVARPAAADDLSTLRAELQALKSDYTARIQTLEERIAQLETQLSAAEAIAPSEPLPAAAPAATAATSSGATAFNPAMSVILAGNYAHTSQDPATFAIAGFIPTGGEIGPGERSFNLGESEITLSANIDPYFAGSLTAALSPEDEIEVEEAFVRTIALPEGFTAKMGRFFSGIGYLNEVHAHAWDFTDQPLAYQAFYGGQLAQNGVQVKWIAPTDLFVEIGAESGNGDAFPGTRREANGLNGAAAFAHVGSDIGDSASWRAGVSYLDVRAQERAWDDVDADGLPVVNAFTGTSKTWAGDFVLKWSPQGNPTQRNLKVQGEYLRREEDGTLAFDVDGAALNGDFSSRQNGWYLQSVYQFRPRWRLGARYDALDSGNPRIGLVDSGELPPQALPALLAASPSRLTLMVDWNPSEFSRLRAQFAWDESRDQEQDRQFQLQYLYSLGAHGAHKF